MAFDITEIIDKLPPLRIPGLHSTESIGIDLGSSSIKIVQFKGVPGKYALARWSVIPLSTMAEGDKVELSPEERKANTINTLKNYRGTGKNIPKNAATSVSGNAVIVRYVKFQKLTRKELSKTIKAEAEPYIPFNVEEVFIGFHPLRDVTEEGKQKMETVLVAAKKDYVNQKIEIMESAGFKPSIVDVDAFALESIYEATLAPQVSDESVLIANIGFSKTNFTIIEKGLSVVVKDSPVSGNSITKQLMKSLGIDFRTAEKLKLANGILSPEEKEAAAEEQKKEALAVSEAAIVSAKELATETKKIIQYYYTQGKDKKIAKIVIAGGGANLKNLAAYLFAELGVPVEKINTFSKVGGAHGIPEEYQTTLAVAAGLALRRPGDIKE